MFVRRLVRLRPNSQRPVSVVLQRCALSSREPPAEQRPGQHKTPIVDHLWAVREQVLQRAQERLRAAQAQPASGASPPSGDDPVVAQAPSKLKVAYPFSSDASLREVYLSPFGDKIRVAKVLEDLDALAGNIAFEHCSRTHGDFESILLVTASIDRVVLNHRANLVDDIELSGSVTWVGSSSMEIGMSAVSSWSQTPWLTALFTFVARDKATGRAARVNPLQPSTPEELAAFEAGKARAELRKRLRGDDSEHCLFSEHVEEVMRGAAATHEAATVTIEQAAQVLFAESKPRLLMPAIALRDAVRCSDTELSNTFVMQPQQRNTAGRIFGGFLVRRAQELAFSTAFLFAGVAPRFRECDQVLFRKPVNIGDLVHFKSCVLFTSNSLHHAPSIHIEVLAFVLNPANPSDTNVSNSFNFTFEVPEDTALVRVLPETRDEARRIVKRYFADVAQKFESDAESDAAPVASP